MSNNYDVNEIEVHTGLKPVQLRPGMYTHTDSPDHIGIEALDNAVDEASAGHAKTAHLILHDDLSMEIIDDGRGMPVAIHPEHGVSGVELIMTRLHAGAKFSKKSYKFSSGLHGVGISVTNALSKKLEVTVKEKVKSGKWCFVMVKVKVHYKR